MLGRHALCFADNVTDRFQRSPYQEITDHKQQGQADDEQHQQGFPQFSQVIISVPIVGRSRDHIRFSLPGIEHSHALIVAHIKLDFPILQDVINHLPVFLHDVILNRIVIQHPEIGGIDSHLHLIDEFTVVQINGLHGRCVHLLLKKQMRLGYRLLLQVVKKSPAARMLAHQINQYHTQQEYHSNHSGILQSQSGFYLHNLSENMKPTPGFV